MNRVVATRAAKFPCGSVMRFHEKTAPLLVSSLPSMAWTPTEPFDPSPRPNNPSGAPGSRADRRGALPRCGQLGNARNPAPAGGRRGLPTCRPLPPCAHTRAVVSRRPSPAPVPHALPRPEPARYTPPAPLPSRHASPGPPPSRYASALPPPPARPRRRRRGGSRDVQAALSRAGRRRRAARRVRRGVASAARAGDWNAVESDRRALQEDPARSTAASRSSGRCSTPRAPRRPRGGAGSARRPRRRIPRVSPSPRRRSVQRTRGRENCQPAADAPRAHRRRVVAGTEQAIREEARRDMRPPLLDPTSNEPLVIEFADNILDSSATPTVST